NDSPSVGSYLNLRLIHDTPTSPGGAEALPAAGSPVIGAQVAVTTPDGRILLGHVDGGSGHSGKRSFEVMLGLGEVSGPVDVRLSWRDRSGTVREQDLRLAPGRHLIKLGAQAQEVTS
ncbi:MAG TPA: ASPIC/UnbV domain-containing protein, partial [Micromonosporaceae bacterium]|nr:ASPIC/UnbV domain-containing protein [Micromonosporaceae bacterium]